MKIILLQDVKKHGKKGEIIDVLIPIINNTLNTSMKVDKIDHATLISSYYIVSISETKPLKSPIFSLLYYR